MAWLWMTSLSPPSENDLEIENDFGDLKQTTPSKPSTVPSKNPKRIAQTAWR